MVALVLTRTGFDDIRPRAHTARDAIWVGAGVLTDAEATELRQSGMSLTVFSHPLDPLHLDADIATVLEHHPGEVLWVETVAG